MNANGIKLNIAVQLETIVCCEKTCGVLFAADVEWVQMRRRDHAWFYCPSGHRQQFPGETAEEKRIRELEASNRFQAERARQAEADVELERLAREQVQRSLSATKGVLTRTRNRVAKGVCPCCNRTFQQLAQHMARKHPDYAETESASS